MAAFSLYYHNDTRKDAGTSSVLAEGLPPVLSTAAGIEPLSRPDLSHRSGRPKNWIVGLLKEKRGATLQGRTAAMPLHFCLPDTISREEVLHALLASRGDRGLAGCRVGLTCYFDTLIHQLYPLVPGVTPRLGSGR